MLDRQIKDMENERRQRIRQDETPSTWTRCDILLELWGVGLNGAWLLVLRVVCLASV